MLYNEIDQIVATTHDTVNKLLSYKNWPDALALYFRYIQQRKMQENSTTFSSTRFMKKATWRWQDRFLKAKKILLECKMIEEITKKNEDWVIEWRYIKVNFIIHSVPETGTGGVPETPLVGKQVQNTLVENKNTLVENKKEWFDDFWKLYPHPRTSNKKLAKSFYENCENTKDEIVKEVIYIKWCLDYWLIDAKYTPACHQWMKDFVIISDFTKNQNIKKIVYALMQNKEKDPETAKKLMNDFWKETVDKYVKEYNKEFNTPILK